MVLEFADGGTLRAYLARRFNELTWKDKYKLGLDITNGLKYLHALDIVHKDLVWYHYFYQILSYLDVYCIVQPILC